MTISFIDATSVSGSGTSATPTEPTGAAENDILILCCGINTTDGVWTDPADFTEIDQLTATAGAPDQRIYLGYKKRGSDAGNGYAMSYGGTSSNYNCVLTCHRGQDLVTPFDVTYVQGTHHNAASNAMNTAAAAITTANDNAWVLLYYIATNPGLTGFGAPSGFGTREAKSATVNAYMCDIAKASAGLLTPGVYTHSGDDAQDPRNFTLALRVATASSKLAVLKRNRHF